MGDAKSGAVRRGRRRVVESDRIKQSASECWSRLWLGAGQERDVEPEELLAKSIELNAVKEEMHLLLPNLGSSWNRVPMLERRLKSPASKNSHPHQKTILASTYAYAPPGHRCQPNGP